MTGDGIKKMMLRKFETEARKALGPLPDKTSIPKVGFMYTQSYSNPTVLYGGCHDNDQGMVLGRNASI